ncbi:MAG: hypothetical protein ACT6RD_14460, partial [Brevundimonas sp.]|uniref:hypothetical protein n=1 Tax=Brevundimonas sp. TaxID=1871086 RepID=UPI0040341A77
MTISRTAVLAMAAGMLVAGTALAQTAPADQGPVEVLNTPGSQPAPNPVAPGAEHDWHPFSSNAMRVYMADVQTIVIDGDVRRVQVAKPPLQGAPGDYSHAVEVVEFRCDAKQSRSTTEIHTTSTTRAPSSVTTLPLRDSLSQPRSRLRSSCTASNPLMRFR